MTMGVPDQLTRLRALADNNDPYTVVIRTASGKLDKPFLCFASHGFSQDEVQSIHGHVVSVLSRRDPPIIYDEDAMGETDDERF